MLASCTIDEAGIETSTIDADECEASGGEFCSIDGSSISLELIINTTKDMTSDSANSNCNGNTDRDADGILGDIDENGNDGDDVDEDIFCFDISGDCNEAGLDLAAIVATTSISGSAESANLGSCKRGKFHVQLRLKLETALRCLSHQVEIELIGKKADGTEVRQPARAKKTIFVKVQDHPDCVTP